MIALLTGKLVLKAADHLVLDVSGVGYEVFVPLSTYYEIPGPGDELTLHIHTHLREDSLSLFGFLTIQEKEAFLQLLSVSGIGPRLALAVLSSMTVEDLVCSVQSSDDARLCSIPGIGKKTAARLVLELKDKVKSLGTKTPPHPSDGRPAPPNEMDDAVSALINLGYKKSVAEDALRKVQRVRTGAGVEVLIREALGELMKR